MLFVLFSKRGAVATISGAAPAVIPVRAVLSDLSSVSRIDKGHIYLMTLVLFLVYCNSFSVLASSGVFPQKRCKVMPTFSFVQIFPNLFSIHSKPESYAYHTYLPIGHPHKKYVI